MPPSSTLVKTSSLPEPCYTLCWSPFWDVEWDAYCCVPTWPCIYQIGKKSTLLTAQLHTKFHSSWPDFYFYNSFPRNADETKSCNPSNFRWYISSSFHASLLIALVDINSRVISYTRVEPVWPCYFYFFAKYTMRIAELNYIPASCCTFHPLFSYCVHSACLRSTESTP